MGKLQKHRTGLKWNYRLYVWKSTVTIIDFLVQNLANLDEILKDMLPLLIDANNSDLSDLPI
jgi:hypothetical protein